MLLLILATQCFSMNGMDKKEGTEKHGGYQSADESELGLGASSKALAKHMHQHLFPHTTDEDSQITAQIEQVFESHMDILKTAAPQHHGHLQSVIQRHAQKPVHKKQDKKDGASKKSRKHRADSSDDESEEDQIKDFALNAFKQEHIKLQGNLSTKNKQLIFSCVTGAIPFVYAAFQKCFKHHMQ
jgi:hypothetical protein